MNPSALIYKNVKMNNFSRILAFDFYVPSGIISNQFLSKELGVASDKIYEDTGVLSRYRSAENEISSDMAVKAAEKIFKNYSYDREKIDYLIYCTQSFDWASPTTACSIQDKLGLKKSIGAIDVGLGCSGFVYALGLAKALIENGQVQDVLILTAETLTKYLHPEDKATRLLFGDAATATIVGLSDSCKIEKFIYGSDGNGSDIMHCKRGGYRHPLQEQISDEDLYYFKMDGLKVFYFSLKTVPGLIKQILDKNGLKDDFSDIDWIVLHQASKIILNTLVKKLKIPKEKMLYSLEEYGNTVSSTIPLTISINQKNGTIKPGDRILIAGFGVGLSWGGTVVEL